MTKIKVKIADYEMEAELLAELAPKPCQAFKKHLPLKSKVINERWSGSGQLSGNHFLTITKGKEMLSEIGEKVLWEGAQTIEIDYL